MKLDRIVALILVLGIIVNLNAQNQTRTRNIDIAGIIIDSKTLLPIENAIIYDVKDDTLALTNRDGYFKTRLNDVKGGEIYFMFKIEKEGYLPFIEQEHWGDLTDGIRATYYIGIQNKHLKSKAFSEFLSPYGNLSYEAIHKNFSKIKKQIDFNNTVEIAKKGNENVFFEIENNFYIIGGNSGLIKLKSKDDLISINGEKNIPANEINTLIKRKNVTGMTETGSKKIPVEIYIKK